MMIHNNIIDHNSTLGYRNIAITRLSGCGGKIIAKMGHPFDCAGCEVDNAV